MFGRLWSDSKVIIAVHLELVSGNSFWGLDWVLGKDLKINGASLPLALMASWTKGLVTEDQGVCRHAGSTRRGPGLARRPTLGLRAPASSPAPSWNLPRIRPPTSRCSRLSEVGRWVSTHILCLQQPVSWSTCSPSRGVLMHVLPRASGSLAFSTLILA